MPQLISWRQQRPRPRPQTPGGNLEVALGTATGRVRLARRVALSHRVAWVKPGQLSGSLLQGSGHCLVHREEDAGAGGVERRTEEAAGEEDARALLLEHQLHRPPH